MNLGYHLNIAASEGRHREICKLVNNGACVNSIGFLGMNPLHLASMNGHIEVCRTLLNLGISVDSKNKVGKTALNLAATNGHMKIVQCLISAGAEVDTCDMLDMTPLHWACDRGHVNIVKLLLKHGANSLQLNKFRKSPQFIAYENGFTEITDLMEYEEVDGCSSEDTFESVEEYLLDTGSEDSEFPSSSDSHCTMNSCNLNDNGLSCLNNEDRSEFTTSSPLREELIAGVSLEEKTVSDEDEENILDEMKEDSTENSEESSGENKDNDKRNNHDSSDVESLIQDKLINSLNKLEESMPFINNQENVRDFDGTATAELLKAQATLLTLEDTSKMLSRAVFLGRTLQLTEAGVKALEMISPDPFVIPNVEKKEEKERKRRERSRSPKPPECNAVVLRNQSVPELLNELVEACNLSRSLGDGPPMKKNKN